MAERGDISINWALSPRLITVAAPSTELTMQDLHDTLRGLEEELGNLDDYAIVTSAGKEALGGGVQVGITTTLLNAQLSFEPRVSVVENGDVTTGDVNGKTLIDNLADFVSAGVKRGDIIYNITDGSHATVLTVDLPTQLTCDGLSGGVDNKFDVADAYKIFAVVQCNVAGGNLVAVDDVGDEMDPIFPSFGTQIVRTSSSSATLQELEAIQYASYQNAVWLDVVGGSPGTAYPIGTSEFPVNNLADAKVIAAANGFCCIRLEGDFTLEAADDVDGFVLRGQSTTLAQVTATAGCSTNGTVFEDCTVQGALSGITQFRNCKVGDLTGFSGEMHDPVLAGTLTLAGSGFCYLFNPSSAKPTAGAVVIDLGGSGRGLRARGCSGAFRIQNKTGTETVWLDYMSGRVEIASSCNNGVVTVRGICLIQDDSDPGCTVSVAGAVTPAYVADAVWSESEIIQKLIELFELHGLDPTKPLVVTETSRSAGAGVQQSISNDPDQTVVTRI